MLDFIIDGFLQFFPEWLSEKCFGKFYRAIDLKWPNRKGLKIFLSVLLMVLICVITLALAIGIVFGVFYIFVKVFNLSA